MYSLPVQFEAVRYLEGDNSESIRSVGAANNLLHWTYQSANYGGPAMANTTIAAMKLQAELATGDFDGDNKDDLAVVSYVGEAYNMGFECYQSLKNAVSHLSDYIEIRCL